MPEEHRRVDPAERERTEGQRDERENVVWIGAEARGVHEERHAEERGHELEPLPQIRPRRQRGDDGESHERRDEVGETRRDLRLRRKRGHDERGERRGTAVDDGDEADEASRRLDGPLEDEEEDRPADGELEEHDEEHERERHESVHRRNGSPRAGRPRVSTARWKYSRSPRDRM